MRSLLALFGLALLLTACSDTKTDNTVPQSQIEARKYRNDKLTGEGLTIMGGHKQDESGGALGVNSFLWRATLDTLSFMPLTSADPFGGVIITDWYEDPKTPGKRYKVNALILDRSLRPDGVKVTLFKQELSGGVWRDRKVDPGSEQSLEDTILTRARQLKVAQIK